MGRPERAIPDHLPMKPLAERLRELRRRAGSPTYRQLAAVSFYRQHTLSQIVNGRYIGWGCVLTYVAALRAYRPDAVSELELADLRKMHERIRHDVEQAKYYSTQRSNTALWQEVDRVIAGPSREAARTRAPGQWNITHRTNRHHLNSITTSAQLVDSLIDLVHTAGITVDELRHETGPTLDFSWFNPHQPTNQTAQPPDSHAWQALTGRQALTVPAMEDVIRRCGGTDGDCRAWEAAFHRITRTENATAGLDQQTAPPTPQPRTTRPPDRAATQPTPAPGGPFRLGRLPSAFPTAHREAAYLSSTDALPQRVPNSSLPRRTPSRPRAI